MLESDKHKRILISLKRYLYNLFRNSLIAIFVLILALVSISISDGSWLFEEFEYNGGLLDYFTVIPDSSLKEINVSNDVKAENVSEVTYYNVDYTWKDSTFTEESDLFNYKIDPAIQDTNTLYQEFED